MSDYPNLRAISVVPQGPDRTHYSGCWRAHVMCRAALLGEALLAALDLAYVLSREETQWDDGWRDAKLRLAALEKEAGE